MFQLTSTIFALVNLAVIVFIIWQVISALRRISQGVEDIAQTLRRMESRGPQPVDISGEQH